MNTLLRIVFFSLAAMFAWYSWSLYTYAGNTKHHLDYEKSKAIEGALVWQKYNCQACHQIYSLGGYLGPDLTNIYSAKNKGPAYIRTIVETGVKQMPGFKMQEEEISALLEFLKSADQSGVSDPRSFRISNSGMIEQHEMK